MLGTARYYSRTILGSKNLANRPSKAQRAGTACKGEILVLIQGKRVVEGRGQRRGHWMAVHAAVVVSEPKWATVASYCRRRGVDRGAVQCRKRWINLACDFKKIRAWEKGPGVAEGESFWNLGDEEQSPAGAVAARVLRSRGVQDPRQGGGGGGRGGDGRGGKEEGLGGGRGGRRQRRGGGHLSQWPDRGG